MSQKRSLKVYAHLLLLVALAIAQPLYALMGPNPEFLIAHGVSGFRLIFFVFVLSFALPTALFALYVFARLYSEKTGMIVLATWLSVLATLIALPVLTRLTALDGVTAVTIAATAGMAFTAFYVRTEILSDFLTVFSFAAIIFPLYFLIFSPASDLLKASNGFARFDSPEPKQTPPIYFLVFDELPLVSLLDSSLEIDAGRFPNFAALSREAVFYRNHTANSNSTLVSVPNLLSGNMPNSRRGLPSLKNYPNNLFSLLGGHYQIEAVEHGTRLCPNDVCGEVQAERSVLLNDTTVVFGHIIFPPAYRDRLPAINNDWLNFAGASSSGKPVQDVAYFKKTLAWNKRITELESFLEQLDGKEGQLRYFHAMLPHAAWQYLPDGRLMTANSSGQITGIRTPDPKLPYKHMWHESPDAVRVARQRHLLQVGYVDSLIGQFIQKLQRQGVYDRSLIVITSDHGMSFRAGGARRDSSETDFPEIAAVPLLIKYPGNRPSGTDLSNAQMMDIVPTILDVIGVEGHPSMDGQSLLDPDRDNDRDKVVFFNGRGNQAYSPEQYDELLKDVVHSYNDEYGEGDFESLFRSGDEFELVGRSVSELNIDTVSSPSIEIENASYFRQSAPDSPLVQLVVHGTANTESAALPSQLVAVAVDGVIHSVSGILGFKGNETSFEALLPPWAFTEADNQVAVYFVIRKDDEIALLATENSLASDYKLLGESGSWKISIDGRSIDVERGIVPGWCSITPHDAPGLYYIGGWAADLSAQVPAEEILIFMDGFFLSSVKPDRETHRTAEQFDMPGILRSAFRYAISLPAGLEPAKTELRLFALSPAGQISELNYPRNDTQWIFKPNPSAQKE